jgi:uncharacterized protein
LSNALSILLELQKLDDKLLKTEQRHRDIPQQILDCDRQLADATQKLEHQKYLLKEAAGRQRFLEKDLIESNAQLQKKEARRFDVKSNVEYKALLKEIEYAQNENSKKEDEILMLLDEIDTLGKAVRSLEQLVKEKQEHTQQEKHRLAQEGVKIAHLRETLLHQRNSVRDSLEHDIVDKYEQIRTKRQGHAVVVVKDDVCPGCHLGVPPQTVNEVLQTGEVRNCPHCLRILYCVLPDENV